MATYQRIISLVPSLTELLIYLGIGPRLIGRTRFCIHPKQKVEEIEIIGGTKNPRIEKIYERQPDLIIANKEENRKQDVEALSDFTEIHLTEISTIQDALITINELGKKLELEKAAGRLISRISEQLEQKPKTKTLTAAYFIWKDPWMVAGSNTYIHDVLQTYGFQNVYDSLNRYPKTTLKQLASQNPDVILLSSEPYPFKEKHIGTIQEVCPASKIELVNGEWFSWYGSRMELAFEWLNSWRPTLS